MTETEPRVYDRAIVKFNNGHGALLCNCCRVILATGNHHEDVEHYCVECRRITDVVDFRTILSVTFNRMVGD